MNQLREIQSNSPIIKDVRGKCEKGKMIVNNKSFAFLLIRDLSIDL
ncbi:hypothetical protein [Caloranaerobacter sp. TR13]|nr:hypothetical protein [Caloranaerobacter sp. TR13]